MNLRGAALLLIVPLLGSCTSPFARQADPFDQALANIMATRAAAFQAASLERSMAR